MTKVKSKEKSDRKHERKSQRMPRRKFESPAQEQTAANSSAVKVDRSEWLADIAQNVSQEAEQRKQRELTKEKARHLYD